MREEQVVDRAPQKREMAQIRRAVRRSCSAFVFGVESLRLVPKEQSQRQPDLRFDKNGIGAFFVKTNLNAKERI